MRYRNSFWGLELMRARARSLELAGPCPVSTKVRRMHAPITLRPHERLLVMYYIGSI